MHPNGITARRAVVLLSLAKHPASGRYCAAAQDARAAKLAMRLSGFEVEGINFGDAEEPALRDYFGMGLTKLTAFKGSREQAWPLLLRYLEDNPPDLIVTGMRAAQGEGAGTLAYQLAGRMGLPLVPGAVSCAERDGRLGVIQARPRGQRHRLSVPLPAIITVSERAAPPPQVAYAKAKRGTVIIREAQTEPPTPNNDPWQRSPARARARRLNRSSQGASTEDRLAALLGGAGSGQSVQQPSSPEEAARLLIAKLTDEGVI